MIKNKSKRLVWLIPCLMMMLTFSSVAVYARGWYNSLPDGGISLVNNIEDCAGSNIKLEYAMGLDDEESIINELKNDSERLQELDSADIIALCRPTGEFIQTDSSIGYEVNIIRTVKGKELIDSDRCVIYDGFGFGMVDEEILYRNSLCLMRPDCEYLVFLEENPLNSYHDTKFYSFLSIGYANCFNITDMITPTISKNFEDMTISDVLGYDFVSTSEAVTKHMNNLKETVVNKYLEGSD